MNSKKFGSAVKAIRLSAKKTVPQVSEHLSALGHKASEKTIYSWEAGRSQPTPDALLDLCVFCNVSDVLKSFGYPKSLDAENPASGDEAISLDRFAQLLEGLGLIQKGQNLSDDDLAFLAHIIGLLKTWFRQ